LKMPWRLLARLTNDDPASLCHVAVSPCDTGMKARLTYIAWNMESSDWPVLEQINQT
jgi:hypothetical protein